MNGDEVKISKPDPEIYFQAWEKLGVNSTDCLVIEDSPVGATVAKKAGIKIKCFGIKNDNLVADLSQKELEL